MVKDLKNDDIKLYPVPSSSSLNLVKNKTIIGDIEIFDAFGKLLHTENIKSNKGIIDISHFSSGVYILKTDESLNRFVVN